MWQKDVVITLTLHAYFIEVWLFQPYFSLVTTASSTHFLQRVCTIIVTGWFCTWDSIGSCFYHSDSWPNWSSHQRPIYYQTNDLPTYSATVPGWTHVNIYSHVYNGQLKDTYTRLDKECTCWYKMTDTAKLVSYLERNINIGVNIFLLR